MKRFLIGVVVGFMLSGSVAYAAAGYNGYPTMRIFIDGKEVQSDTPAIVVNNRTMVPLRVVSESLGAQVQWDQAQPDIVRLKSPVLLETSVGTVEVFNPELKDFSPLGWQDGVRQLDNSFNYVYVRSGRDHGIIGRLVPGRQDLFTSGVYDPASIYGSPISDFSAYDPAAAHPPILSFGKPPQMVDAAFVTKNPAFPQRIDPDDLAAFLGLNGR